MPMKAMVYKTLSTVVDDFFAYVLFLAGAGRFQELFTGSASKCHSYIDSLASGRIVRSPMLFQN